MTTGEQLIEQGRARGLEQGRAEGRAEGKRQFLLQGLSRLGTVPPEVEARVAGASEAELEAWAERLFSAKSLADVFDAGPS